MACIRLFGFPLIVSSFASLVVGITLGSTQSSVRYLETNSWVFNLGSFTLAVDPVLAAPLDFGIPFLYTGKKRAIDGPKELEKLIESADYVLLSQGLDDHAHSPTLKILAQRRPSLPYIAPPSAVPILKSAGVPQSCISTIAPGQQISLKKNRDELQIRATTGALVGPPWQANENGYVLRLVNGPSIYYEPHCMYDEAELARLQADFVITPVVSQELPYFTLVAGGSKALRLAEILKAKAVIPMANGELEQSGPLAAIIRSEGSAEEFSGLVKAKAPRLRFFSVTPGVPLSIS